MTYQWPGPSFAPGGRRNGIATCVLAVFGFSLSTRAPYPRRVSDQKPYESIVTGRPATLGEPAGVAARAAVAAAATATVRFMRHPPCGSQSLNGCES